MMLNSKQEVTVLYGQDSQRRATVKSQTNRRVNIKSSHQARLPDSMSVAALGSDILLNACIVLFLCENRASYKGIQDIGDVIIKYILIFCSNWIKFRTHVLSTSNLHTYQINIFQNSIPIYVATALKKKVLCNQGVFLHKQLTL